MKKFAALEKDGWTKFYGNPSPICPHCGAEIDVSEHELYGIYSEGDHDMQCPECNEKFVVNTNILITFSTDEQPQK